MSNSKAKNIGCGIFTGTIGLIALVIFISFLFEKEPETREEFISEHFSYDGSHIELTKMIKEAMNDPSSYEHIKTVYYDRDSFLLVHTTFRGKNGFGALVKNKVVAQTEPTEGYVIRIMSQK